MAEPNWAQVLTVVYNQGEKMEVPIEGEVMSKNHELVLKTELTPKEVMNSLQFLSEMNLICLTEKGHRSWDEQLEKVEPTFRELELRPEGFDVAHDREQGIRQEAASSAVGFLTGVLALTALVQATTAYSNTSGLVSSLLIGVMLLGAAIFFVIAWYTLFKSGILDISDLRLRKQRFE